MRDVRYERGKRARLALLAVLMVFAALAGYHWGRIWDGGGIHGHDMLIAAVCFTVLAAIVALVVEAAAMRTEAEVAAALSQKEKKVEESNISKEQARELDRIVSRLSEDNSDLRYQLMSSRLHEVGEQMALSKPASQASHPAWRATTS